MNSPNSKGDASLSQLTDPEYDLAGEAIKFENIVANELEIPISEQRVSYSASIIPGSGSFKIIDSKLQYTEGNEIDNAIKGNQWTETGSNGGNDLIDLSRRNSKDLVFGFLQNDTIYGGSGNDYIYGGDGSDLLFGGSGDDVLHGGELNRNITCSGYDTVSYAQGDNGKETAHGVVINYDVVNSPVINGFSGILVTDDGYSSKDKLFEINEIDCTNFTDKLYIESLNDDLRRDLTIEMAGGG